MSRIPLLLAGLVIACGLVSSGLRTAPVIAQHATTGDGGKAAASELAGAVVDPALLEALEAGEGAEVVVSLRTGVMVGGRGDVSAAAADVGAAQDRVLAAVPGGAFKVSRTFAVVPAIAGRVESKAGLEALLGQPDVLAVSLAREARTTLGETVPLINADDAHVLGITGDGATVAVLDTGIDTNHPALMDDLVLQRCFSIFAACPGGGTTGTSAEDGDGHGTHVSGIITSSGAGSVPVGVAPDASIAAYKVLDDNGSGSFTDVVAAMDDIILNQPSVDIINMSLGDWTPHAPGTCDGLMPALTSAVATLNGLGVTVVAASGNTGSSLGMGFPACVSGVVSVGATYDANLGFQSWGACTDSSTAANQLVCFTDSDPTIDLLAPGASITSAALGGGAVALAGTSMASPAAAGVAALLEEDEPGLTPAQVEARLRSTGLAVFDARNGVTACRVDALKAVQNPGGTPCATTVLPPLNDNIVNSQPTGPGETRTQSTFAATLESGEPQPCGSIGATVWFVAVPAFTGIMNVTTAGSTFDTVLAAYDGGISPPGVLGSNLACNDDFDGRQSRIAVPVVEGQTYFIQAGGFNGATGTLTLSFPPPNDNFANRFGLAAPSAFQQLTGGATVEAGEPQPCGGIASTVWFEFIAPFSGPLTVDTNGSSFDTVLAVYEPSTSPPGQIGFNVGCDDDSGSGLQSHLEFFAVQGMTYLVQAGGYYGQDGYLTLNIASECSPPHNMVINARPLVPGFAEATCTTGADLEAGEPQPCGGIGATVWYGWVSYGTGLVTVDTVGSDFDTVVAVHEAMISPPGQLGPLVGCNDDFAGGAQSQVTFGAVTGRAYYIQAGGFLGATGNLVVNVACVGDTDCDGAGNLADNCPGSWNPDQVNTDAEPFVTISPPAPAAPLDATVPTGDLLGDVCDEDDDNDTLSDEAESAFGSPSPPGPCGTASAPTDSLQRDTDGDRVVDGAECLMGSDPSWAGSKPPSFWPLGDDDDGDSLPDWIEAAVGSNPIVVDTDGDRIPDGAEVKGYGSSPLTQDSDGDGCSDGKEISSVNADRAVNSIDQLLVAQRFGRTDSPVQDIDKNGIINILDLSIMAAFVSTAPCTPGT